LIGAFHSNNSPLEGGVPTLCTRLLDQGINVLSIDTSSKNINDRVKPAIPPNLRIDLKKILDFDDN
jgi:hypothetical protein